MKSIGVIIAARLDGKKINKLTNSQRQIIK